MRLKSFAPTIAVLLTCSNCLVIDLMAQTPQQPSIADAARQNREQKKSAPKSGNVITNDTLSPTSSTVAATTATAAPQVGANPANAAQAPAAAESAAPKTSAQPELSKEDAAKLKSEIATIQQELKDKQSAVELLQRLLNLDREALLSKPDSSRDTDGKAKLDAEQDELQQKSAEFEKLKAKLQSMAPELVPAEAPPKS
jgi:hypothetical protein